MTSKKEELITTQYKIVLPNTLNNNETLFGGTAMQWMDEVAYIEAIRYTKKKMVTVSTDEIKFLKPIKCGEIVAVIAKVINESSVKLKIQVDVFIEDLVASNKQKAITSLFTFAAIDNNHKPIRIK